MSSLLDALEHYLQAQTQAHQRAVAALEAELAARAARIQVLEALTVRLQKRLDADG